ADPANQPIPKRGHLAESNSRPVLDHCIGLWQRRQDNVARLHCRLTSANVYSGSESEYARASPSAEKLLHSECSLSCARRTANFSNHWLKMASSDADKRFTSASSSWLLMARSYRQP